MSDNCDIPEYGDKTPRQAVGRTVDTGLSPQQVEALALVLGPLLERAAEAMAPAIELLNIRLAAVARQAQAALAPLYSPELHTRLLRGAKALLPVLATWVRLDREVFPNWPHPMAYPALRRIAVEEGIPVAWVPRKDVLVELIAAEDELARELILLERAEDILEDCHLILKEVVAIRLQEPRQLLAQATGCVRKFPAPAQAFCLVAAACLAGDIADQQSLAKLKARLVRAAETPGLPPVGELRRGLALLPVTATLTNFRPERGDAVPAKPNRHAVAHVLAAVQYSEHNALVSVMLATSLLRQLQDHLDSFDESRYLVHSSAATTAQHDQT